MHFGNISDSRDLLKETVSHIGGRELCHSPCPTQTEMCFQTSQVAQQPHHGIRLPKIAIFDQLAVIFYNLEVQKCRQTSSPEAPTKSWVKPPDPARIESHTMAQMAVCKLSIFKPFPDPICEIYEHYPTALAKGTPSLTWKGDKKKNET
jgi:hypothetical protein